MKKGLENIKFNLTKEMSLELIKFNKTKKELYNKKKLYNLDKNQELLLDIEKLSDELDLIRKNFITKFQQSNKKEIIEYLKCQKEDQK